MLRGKTILVVDDEPDVLETMVEVLDMCLVETAGTFNKACQLLETKEYNIVMLDIMGVKGIHLLDLAVERRFPAVMLTAPAVISDYILKSMNTTRQFPTFPETTCLPRFFAERGSIPSN